MNMGIAPFHNLLILNMILPMQLAATSPHFVQ